LIQAAAASRVGSVISHCTGREVFCCMTMARVATRSPWQMSLTFKLTRSQARGLLSIPRSNSASFRVRANSWSLTRIAQISFGLHGAFWPASLPLFHGSGWARTTASSVVSPLKGQRKFDSAPRDGIADRDRSIVDFRTRIYDTYVPKSGALISGANLHLCAAVAGSKLRS
jgi:hypothetical protein